MKDIADTGLIVALLFRNDPFHSWAHEAFRIEPAAALNGLQARSLERDAIPPSFAHRATEPEINTRKPPMARYLCDMPNISDVIENALALSIADRSYVASKLIESLENEKLSGDEIAGYDQRVARWKAGTNPSSSSDELDAKARAILQS